MQYKSINLLIRRRHTKQNSSSRENSSRSRSTIPYSIYKNSQLQESRRDSQLSQTLSWPEKLEQKCQQGQVNTKEGKNTARNRKQPTQDTARNRTWQHGQLTWSTAVLIPEVGIGYGYDNWCLHTHLRLLILWKLLFYVHSIYGGMLKTRREKPDL